MRTWVNSSARTKSFNDGLLGEAAGVDSAGPAWLGDAAARNTNKAATANRFHDMQWLPQGERAGDNVPAMLAQGLASNDSMPRLGQE
jgi:hypothetical protein